MRARAWWIAGIVVALLVTAGVVVLSRGGGARPDAGADEGVANGLDPLGGVAEAPNVTDSGTVDFDVTLKASHEGTAALSQEQLTAWQTYLAETAGIARDNAPALKVLVDTAIDALVDDDVPSLSAVWAPDEAADTSYIESVAAAYPNIVTGDFQRTVNVFAVKKSTVYFAYALVEWTDGGITSSHTVALPARFIGDRWYLSSIGLNTEGLTQVQTVALR